ncbi:MAG TPA: methyltransferase domain-containing protein [Terracidiphilus sp.]|jgi:SAM-dependent methyltransferase
MLYKDIDLTRRADIRELTEIIDDSCDIRVMRDYLRDLARLNRWFLGYRPTLKWLEQLNLKQYGETIRILDVGCGYGDTLRQVEDWARKRGIATQLIGLDLNPDTIAIARDATPPDSGIRWIASDVFCFRMEKRVHLVINSLFTHHLSDANIVRFLRWMEERAAIGWFINDLSRAPIPYHLYGWFARAVRLHSFVRHDGQVSFARAFQPQDWRRLCGEAGLADDKYEIEAHKPARLCVSRSKAR